jgi:type IV pilus assembly protein PilM
MFKGKLDFAWTDLLQAKAPPLIGVDISSSAVKMVELAEAGRNRYSVERYAIEPLARDAVVDGNVNNLEAVGECMKRAWKRLGTRVKNVALALPAAAVITKKIIVPAGLREDDLGLQVQAEANQYIPFALDEVNLDFQVIGPAPSSPEEVEVLIAASRKEKVEDRVAAAQAAGLKAVVMDVEPYATQTALGQIQRQLPEGGKDQTIAIVDIGASVMAVNVLRNDQSLYMRDQPFGGNQLTQEIQRHFNLSPEEAEAAKRNGGLPDSYETEVLGPFRETLALEVARALQFFFTSTQYNEVNHILLAGGSAMIPGLDDTVAARTQVNTLIANPFANMELSSRIRPRQLAQDAPALMIACGLALRRFDPS